MSWLATSTLEVNSFGLKPKERCVGLTRFQTKCRAWSSYKCSRCGATLCSWHVKYGTGGPHCLWCAGEGTTMEKVIQGELIVVEGIDGCGKTSHSQALAEFLGAQWRRFPNRETPFGKLIDLHLKKLWAAEYQRDMVGIDHQPEAQMDALVFQAIQIANRVEFAQDFRAALKKSHIVCDRYWPSGYAFGGADGLDKAYMVEIHEGLLQPDLLILFDVEVEEAVKRMDDRQRDRYEADTALQRTVANNYRELWELKKNDPRFVKINANGSKEETWAQLKAIVEARVHPFKIS